MNKIKLKFDKQIILLAGRDFGIAEFNKQVKNKINYKEQIVFIFPDHIQSMASSFIQGFFLDIVEHIGIGGVKDKVEVKNNRMDFKQLVLDNLI